jgi:hypothetical protein
VDRHLLPHEFDVLLDGDSGFGLGPLRAHVRDCAECRAEFEEAQAVLAELDRLPHLAPTPGFGDRVMTRVQVFEPWHVALADTVRGLVPASPAMRAVAAAGALAFGAVFTVATLWIVARVDLLALATDLSAERSRAALGAWAGSLVAALLGEGARGASAGLVLAALAVAALALVGGALGLRAAVVRSGEERA